MSFALPNEEQKAVAEGVASFLADHYPLSRFRDGQVADTARWTELAELGLLGISLPEAAGGMGLGWTDEALCCREAGRYLLSPALIGSVLALHIAQRNNLDEVCNALRSGARSAGLAIAPGAELTVTDAGDGWAVIVEAQGLRLVDVADCERKQINCIDDTVTLHSVKSTPVELAAVADIELALAARLLVAAALCGVLECARDMAADYARTRVQFGRPIGAFQGIKHRCADMALAAELCWSQTLQAAAALDNAALDNAALDNRALDNRAGDVQFHVLAAKLLAGEEALHATRFNIQAHGGMGFTDEADAHRLLKRAHLLQQLFDEPRQLARTLPALPLEL